MRIGIDCRMAGTGEGIARYVEELVRHFALVDHENDYVLFFQDEASSAKCKVQSAKFRNEIVHSKYYSFAEQTRFIRELKRLQPDLVHFPSFNAPILYPGKFVVTIHDMIHHRYPGKKKSRFFQRLAYRTVMRAAIRRSRKIIAVSQSTKDEIRKSYDVPEDKIEVIYEGVDEKFFKSDPNPRMHPNDPNWGHSGRYILFVGVWRQYKNLPRLARAFDIIKKMHDVQLVLAGKIDPHYPEIKEQVLGGRHGEDIRALGFVSDEDLRTLYRGAAALVIPSLVEGFGLIGVEAQACGAPVAASDIAVLREVLGAAASYFDPQSEQDMAEKISKIITDDALRAGLVEQGRRNAKRFDWRKAAEATLAVYKL